MFKVLKTIIFLLIVVGIGSCLYYLYISSKAEEKMLTYYLASADKTIKLYDENLEEVKDVVRGTEVKTSLEKRDDYVKVFLDNVLYYVKEGNIIKDNNVVLEDSVYIRTSVSVYEDSDSLKISGMIPKGSLVKVIGYDKLNSDGSVNKYKVSFNDISGYIYSKYTVNSEEEAIKMYDNGHLETHLKRTDRYGGGSGDNLDYYPYPKASFTDNIMPEEVRSLYINVNSLSNIDAYISLAKESNINAFVVDIKENTVPGYKGEVFKNYSPTNYEYAVYSLEEYKTYIDKIKDAGIYLIGRISTFKDAYYISDHPDYAILDKNGSPYKYNSSY